MERGYIKVDGKRIDFPEGIRVIDRYIIMDLMLPEGMTPGAAVISEIEERRGNVSFLGEKECYLRDKLEEVYLPDSLRLIDSNTFNSCWELKRVLVPEECSLAYIGSGAFNDCENLAKFALDECYDLQFIGEAAFYRTRLLEEDFTDIRGYKSEDAFSERWWND